jgi:hypothetical protein
MLLNLNFQTFETLTYRFRYNKIARFYSPYWYVQCRKKNLQYVHRSTGICFNIAELPVFNSAKILRTFKVNLEVFNSECDWVQLLVNLVGVSY